MQKYPGQSPPPKTKCITIFSYVTLLISEASLRYACKTCLSPQEFENILRLLDKVCATGSAVLYWEPERRWGSVQEVVMMSLSNCVSLIGSPLTFLHPQSARSTVSMTLGSRLLLLAILVTVVCAPATSARPQGIAGRKTVIVVKTLANVYLPGPPSA